MKRCLVWLLLIVSSGLSAQSERKLVKETITTNSYLKVAFGKDDILYCGYARIEFFINKSMVKLDTPYGHLDLSIVDRTRDYWVGIDSYKNEYLIITIEIGGDYGFVIAPKDTHSGLIGFALNRNPNLCK